MSTRILSLPSGAVSSPPAVRSRRAVLGLTAFALVALAAPARSADLWDVPDLQRPPAVIEWGARDGLVQEVYYSGESYQGKPTRVFGYVGRPKAAGPQARYPAVVLVHGGGGQAFRVWAERWAQRGYVALAMDLSGNGPGKVRLPDGGPPLGDPNIFLAADSDAPFREGWPYHAVADAIRGYSLVASLPEVDSTRIGITGISWGGFVTCLVAGLDHRPKVSVPVYGAGYLQESSFWKEKFIDPMSPTQRERWVRLYDPSSYLAHVRHPILFVNGANDPRFFLDGHRRSMELVPAPLRHAAIIVGLKHGHNFNLPEVDRFIDAAIKGEPLPPQFDRLMLSHGTVSARISSPANVQRVEAHYTASTAPWPDKKWTTVPATLRDGIVSVALPAERPQLIYFSALDAAGVRATSLYAEFAR
jgi:dienelactone hydrolase